MAVTDEDKSSANTCLLNLHPKSGELASHTWKLWETLADVDSFWPHRGVFVGSVLVPESRLQSVLARLTVPAFMCDIYHLLLKSQKRGRRKSPRKTCRASLSCSRGCPETGRSAVRLHKRLRLREVLWRTLFFFGSVSVRTVVPPMTQPVSLAGVSAFDVSKEANLHLCCGRIKERRKFEPRRISGSLFAV